VVSGQLHYSPRPATDHFLLMYQQLILRYRQLSATDH
jgi:hypothetical protein